MRALSLRRPRNADRPYQLPGRHDVGKQRTAHAEVRGTYQAHDRDDDHDIERSQIAGQRQRHGGRGQCGIGQAHRGQEIAMPDPVPDHPEYRRDQGPDILQRCEHGQQQHRAGLNHDVPAEHKRLYLKRPGGEQIGGPLKAVVADVEWRKRGNPRGSAQDAMTRFTAFPALLFVLCGKESRLRQRNADDAGVNRNRGIRHARHHQPRHTRAFAPDVGDGEKRRDDGLRLSESQARPAVNRSSPDRCELPNSHSCSRLLATEPILLLDYRHKLSR